LVIFVTEIVVGESDGAEEEEEANEAESSQASRGDDVSSEDKDQSKLLSSNIQHYIFQIRLIMPCFFVCYQQCFFCDGTSRYSVLENLTTG